MLYKKNANPQSKRFGLKEACKDLCETVVVWITGASQHLHYRWKRWIYCKRNRKIRDCWQLIGWRGRKLAWQWLSQSSRSRWWRDVDLLDLPIQTQDHTSLCRAQGKTVWYPDNAPSKVLKFLLWNVLPVSTKSNLRKLLKFFKYSILRNCEFKTDDWSRR